MVRSAPALWTLLAALVLTPAPASADPPMSDFETLQQYGTDVKSALPALIEGLKSKEVSIRRNSAFALGEIGPDAASADQDLARTLKNDPDAEVRRNAAFALGEIGTPSIHILIGTLGDKDTRTRRFVASALVRIGHPAVPYLIKKLADPDLIIRKNAAGILGRIGPRAKEAIPALESALQDENKAFCWTAKQALRKIKQVTVQDMIDCLNDKDVVIRVNAAKNLGQRGESAAEAVPALILCLGDEKAAVRQNASFALAAIGVPAVPRLIKALESPDAILRKNAAFCLGEMGGTAAAALPSLRRLLSDPDKNVRWCADIAINKIGSPANPPAQD